MISEIQSDGYHILTLHFNAVFQLLQSYRLAVAISPRGNALLPNYELFQYVNWPILMAGWLSQHNWRLFFIVFCSSVGQIHRFISFQA